MENSTMLLIGLLLVFLLIVTILLMAKKKKENFRKCVCTSREEGREQACQDIETVQKLYDDSVLTEYTNLKAPGWDRGANPGEYDFPKSAGCNWAGGKPTPTNPSAGGLGRLAASQTKEWQAWDFTQFGS